MRTRTLPEAEDELGLAAAYYEARRPGLGVDFIMTVDDAINEIAERPLAYPRWRGDRPYRRFTLQRFPYSVFYVPASDERSVVIVAVAHDKREPGYWERRITDDD